MIAFIDSISVWSLGINPTQTIGFHIFPKTTYSTTWLVLLSSRPKWEEILFPVEWLNWTHYMISSQPFRRFSLLKQAFFLKKEAFRDTVFTSRISMIDLLHELITHTWSCFPANTEISRHYTPLGLAFGRSINHPGQWWVVTCECKCSSSMIS